MSGALHQFGVPLGIGRGGLLQPLGHPRLNWCFGHDNSCEFGPGAELETCVDLPHSLRWRSWDVYGEIHLWAVMNLRGSYRHWTLYVASDYPRTTAVVVRHMRWRWMFSDLNDAFAFKMRWA